MPFDTLGYVLCFQWGSGAGHSEPAPVRPTGGDANSLIPLKWLIPGHIEYLHTLLRRATVGYGHL